MHLVVTLIIVSEAGNEIVVVGVLDVQSTALLCA